MLIPPYWHVHHDVIDPVIGVRRDLQKHVNESDTPDEIVMWRLPLMNGLPEPLGFQFELHLLLLGTAEEIEFDSLHVIEVVHLHVSLPLWRQDHVPFFHRRVGY